MQNENPEPVRLYEENGLFKTNIHGATQDVYILTEDRIENLNSYSMDFQIFLVFISAIAGGIIGLIPSYNNDKQIFYGCIILLVIFLGFGVRAYKRVEAVKKKFVTKVSFDKKLKIIEALYGTAAHSIDITDKLSVLIKENKLSFTINNEFAGEDPVPNTPKILKIKYVSNSALLEKEFKESELVILP